MNIKILFCLLIKKFRVWLIAFKYVWNKIVFNIVMLWNYLREKYIFQEFKTIGVLVLSLRVLEVKTKRNIDGFRFFNSLMETRIEEKVFFLTLISRKTQNKKYYTIPLIWCIQNSRIQKQKIKWLSRASGRGKWRIGCKSFC